MFKTILSFGGAAALLLGSWSQTALAQVNPGDLITKDHALVDENVGDGFSTVIYSPGHEGEDRESWYINMGVVGDNYFQPQSMESVGH